MRAPETNLVATAGTRAWGDEEVVRTLKLTHDQRVEMAVIRDEYDTKRRDLQKVEKDKQQNAKEQQKKAEELKSSINEAACWPC